MSDEILANLTGQDERADFATVMAYLREQPVLVPQRPRRFLDVAEFTKEQLMEQIRLDSEQLANEAFEPWILETDGKLRLPVFTSQARMQVFASKVSQDLSMVFGLGCISILLEEVTKRETIDFVDLNPLNEKSWEIGLRRRE